MNDIELRHAAEIENMRKRHAKEIADAKSYANQAFVRDLLPVLDILENAIQSTTATDAFTHGIRQTQKMLTKTLENHGVSSIITQVGERFDPHYHHAVDAIEDSNYPPNTIAKILQEGYAIGSRIIRPTSVILTKGK